MIHSAPGCMASLGKGLRAACRRVIWLDRFVRKLLPSATLGHVFKLIRKGRVRVNGRKVGNAPVTVDMLDPGTHRVEATWEGKAVKCVVTVRSGTVTVSVDPAAGKCSKL